jgi:membrane protease YdiL (CAAX protease family)
MGLWAALEFLIRDGGVLFLGWLSLPRPITSVPWEHVVRLSVSMHVVAMLALGWIFLHKVRRDGLSWREIGYERSRRAFVAGGLGGAAVLVLTNGTALLDYEIFRSPILMQFALAARAAGPAAHVALVLGNGILAPIVEELAWRGYVQTRLARAWPGGLALAVTAAGFAIKHLIVDLSVTRLTTLAAAALALGFIRAQYGTSASTVAHLTVNLSSTILLIAQEPALP